MMRIVALVVTLGQVSGLLQVTPGGHAITSATYLLPANGAVPTVPDTSFNAANLYSYQYVVMGACIPTSTGGSVMYSYNAGTAAVGGVPATGVVLDTWTTSTTCAGTANTLNAYQAPGGPGLTVNGGVTYNVYLATLPAVPGTSATTRFFSATGCAAHYGGQVQASNVVNGGAAIAAACTSSGATTTYPVGTSGLTTATNQFTTVTPNLATSTTPSTTLVPSTAGSAFVAAYDNAPLNCGAATAIPQAINQVAPSTCSPMLAGGSGWARGQPSPFAPTYPAGTILSSQVIVYTAPGAVVNNAGTLNPQIISIVLYTGAQCTGTIAAIQTFQSSTTFCWNNNLVFYSATATLTNPTTTTTFAAINQIMPATQQASSTSLFRVHSFYSSLSGCQGSSAGMLQMLQYAPAGQKQGTIGTCANPVLGPSTQSPQLWNNALCTTTSATATANNIVQVQMFTDAQCTIPVAGLGAYQVGVCVVTGASSSYNYAQTTTNGVLSLIQNTFTNNACSGTPTQTTLASVAASSANCGQNTWAAWGVNLYIRLTQTSTLGPSQTGTANTGTQNSVSWVASYNSQAGCNSQTLANAAYYFGSMATCVSYIPPDPTASPTTIISQRLATGSFFSSVTQGCSVPNPTATPTVAPTAVPTAAVVTTTTVSTALSASGAAVTASLAAAYNGIVVANAVTTVTGAGVSATQNIQTGVTVAQAQTPAFQTAFIAAVAAVANVPTSSVTGYTATQGRRLLAGVNVAYNVAVAGASTSTPNNVGTASCFAATELVTLENGSTKAMSDVRVGDRILTVNAKTGAQVYADVAYLPHGQNTDKAVFTVLATASGRDVKLTANHVLPAGACDVATASLPYVAASSVVVGDCVETVSGRERVVSVSTAAGEGIYTAIAMEELLVVNGVVATPYGGVNPALANVYYNLHRLAYAVAGKAVLAVQGATEGVWGALAMLAAATR